MTKLSELWEKVKKTEAEHTESGLKMAIVEAHKVLEAALDSKKYPGNTTKKKLFWAGYSLKEKDGLADAISRRNDIVNKIDFQMTTLDAEEAIRVYKHTIDEIMKKPGYSIQDKAKMIIETQFSPKNVTFWRNAGIFFGFFLAIKLLTRNSIGEGVSNWFINLADFIISWQFLLLTVVVAGIIFAVVTYFAGKSKVRIKE